MRRITKHGTVPGYRPAGLTIATDAAVDPVRRKAGMAYLATDGAWGLVLRPLEGADVLTCELRAVFYALDRPVPDGSITVLTDSQDAVRYLQSWQNGEDCYPPGYVTQTGRRGVPHLVALRNKVTSAPRRYTFTWTRAHVGHPLNEFADSAAKLAIHIDRGLAGRLEASRLPPGWAQARLEEWGTYQEER